jgi:hypothetical protein
LAGNGRVRVTAQNRGYGVEFIDKWSHGLVPKGLKINELNELHFDALGARPDSQPRTAANSEHRMNV